MLESKNVAARVGSGGP